MLQVWESDRQKDKGLLLFTSCGDTYSEPYFFFALSVGAGYETKQSDGEVSALLELWEMQSASSLPSLPGPL